MLICQLVDNLNKCFLTLKYSYVFSFSEQSQRDEVMFKKFLQRILQEEHPDDINSHVINYAKSKRNMLRLISCVFLTT